MNRTDYLVTKRPFVILILFFACAIVPNFIYAQDMMGKTGLLRLWDGLKQKQSEELMPHGKALYQTPERKIKQNIPTKLIPVMENEWIISDGWELGTSTQVLESDISIFSHDFNTTN